MADLFKVNFHIDEDGILEITAGANEIGIEIFKEGKIETEAGTYIQLEADETDLLAATLKLFSDRVKKGRYPEITD